ncbi:MAG: ferritin-like domain-containing protein [Cyclobacteriaceae bacterium]
MNVFKIIEEISKVDDAAFDRLGSRRSMLQMTGRFGSKVALASVPLAIGSMVNKAYAGTNKLNDVIDVLNFALTLEHLEYEFYQQVANNMDLLPSSSDARPIIELIRDHELAHVNFLQTAISGAGGTPIEKPAFDFTAGGGSGEGPFPNPMTADNSALPTILAVAQAFEDTGVRAYKGQAGNLISDGPTLQAALQIHSVEARHASEIRRYRGSKGWIVGEENTTGAAAVDAVYEGEDNVTHTVSTGTYDLSTVSGLPGGMDALTESFDEPLTDQEVLNIVTPFLA